MCPAGTKVEFEDLEVTLVENGMTYINITFDRTLEKPIFVNYSLSNIVDSGETFTVGSLSIKATIGEWHFIEGWPYLRGGFAPKRAITKCPC